MTTGPKPSLFPFIQSEEQLHMAQIHLAKIKPADETSQVRALDPHFSMVAVLY